MKFEDLTAEQKASLKGDKGEPGQTGPAGPQGEPGESFVIKGYYTTLSALRTQVTSPAAGDAYGVGSAPPFNIYVWDRVSATWKDNGTIQGPAGPAGSAATIQVGTVTTGAAGTSAQVTNSGSNSAAVFNFVIPQGAQGPQGNPGANGQDGAQGPAGPNEVSTNTNTSISGLLKGDGSKVTAAVAGTDYAKPEHKHSDYATLSSGKVTADQASAGIVNVTANKTLTLADAGTLQKVNSSSAVNIAVPTNSEEAFPDGTEIEILRYGSGTVSILPVGSVTLRYSGAGNRRIAAQYTGVSLKKLATDEWLLMGNLE